MADLERVSILIPCRNERKFIEICLESIIGNDYPKDQLEVLVVDGMSEDGTREVVERYAQRYSYIKLLDNLKKITPAALNVGIANAKGQIIVRMDSHARVRNDYISRAVESLYKYGADNVGGNMETVPREGGFIAQAIVASLSHQFGVGNSYFRVHADEPTWVDTVFGGCYRREVFNRVGMFNERLPSTQDMEFNRRLQRAGGRILLVPNLVTYYYTRSDIKSFWKNNFRNGIWAILPFAYSEVLPVSWRHLAPLLFVTSLIGSVALGLVVKPFLGLFVGIIAVYSLVSLVASFQIARRKLDSRYLVLMPFIFGMLHFGYGLGSLWGVIKLVHTVPFWKKLLALRPRYGTG